MKWFTWLFLLWTIIIIGSKRALLPMSNRSLGFKRDISKRSRCGLIWFGICLKVSLTQEIADWITHTLGGERTGEERCFASWLTLRFAARQTMRRVWSMPFAAFSTPAATSGRNGILRMPSEPGTAQLG